MGAENGKYWEAFYTYRTSTEGLLIALKETYGSPVTDLEEAQLKTGEEIVQLAVETVQHMFTDISDNDPTILEAKRHRVAAGGSNFANRRKVSLFWGDKVNLNRETRVLIDRYNKASGFWKTFGGFPRSIDGLDGYIIQASIDDSTVAISEDVDTLDFLQNPYLLLPQISDALKEPNYAPSELYKASGYQYL